MKILKLTVLFLILLPTLTYAELRNGMDADVVIGQPDFTTKTGVTTQRGMKSLEGKCLVVQNKLIVADQLNSRVLIWNTIPKSSYTPADVVLGQPNFTSSTINNGGRSARSMSSPNALTSDGQKLIVFDQNNFRALIWNQIPTTNQAPADVVIGQSNFTAGTAGVSATKMDRARGLFFDGTRLFIADQPNQRVLIYNRIPETNGAAADVVIGQPNFTTSTSGTSAQKLFIPQGVSGDGKRLFIADAANARVLIYNTVPTQNFAAADIVIGQTDFNTSTAGIGPRKMSAPRDVYYDGKRLFVAEATNNRVLVFNTIPTTNGAPADVVLGQPDFYTTSAGLSRNKFNSARGICSDGKHLIVTEQNNNRLLIFNMSSSAITLGPQFDQGKGVLGKVFWDMNGDGNQDAGEQGVEGVKVVSDTGIYAITDEDGKYHYPFIETGQRVLKIDESTLPQSADGAEALSPEVRKVVVTEGVLTKVSFGLRPSEASFVKLEEKTEEGPMLRVSVSQDAMMLAPRLGVSAAMITPKGTEGDGPHIRFTIDTNYHLLIKRAELKIWTGDRIPSVDRNNVDQTVALSPQVVELPMPLPLTYDWSLPDTRPLSLSTLRYQLSVFDESGKEDRTSIGEIVLGDAGDGGS